MSLARRDDWAGKARFGLVLLLIAACCLWGGASRTDIPGLILLQPLAVIIAFALVLVPGEIRWNVVRLPLSLLAALALVMVIQLIPLPPAVWTALPGHAQLGPFLDAAGTAQPWRPLSLTPDLTLSALIGLIVPAAALIGFASLTEDRTHRLLACLLVVVALSAVLGLAQIGGGARSGFYRYAVTNAGAAVGLFSNRNHQAVLLAAAFPMLAIWMTRRGLNPVQRNLRRWIGWSSALALVPMLTATGSRAGIVLGVIGIGIAWLLLRAEAWDSKEPSALPNWLRRAAPFLLALATVAVVGLAVMLSRAEAIQRLFESNVSEESRVTQLPTLLVIAGDFLPFGAGFGSFDPVFRFYEPDSELRTTYLNHAHNDLVELVITGGLPALIIALLFLVWVARRGLAMRRAGAGSAQPFALVGLAVIALMLLASLTDYPLRAPWHAMFFAIACGWLAAPGERKRSHERG